MFRSVPLLAAALLIALLGIGGVSNNPAAAAHRHPSRQVALGVSTFSSWSSLDAVDAFTASVGRRPATWSIWNNWGGPHSGFPDMTLLHGLYQRGITPLVFWQPTDPSTTHLAKYAYIRIREGDFDSYIKDWARKAKAYHHTIILRFAHEMDGDWFPWSVHRYGNSPKRFVGAWQHIWRIFQNQGATNVRFLWSPLNPCACRHNLYPGDRYVAYVGFTALNWGSQRGEWMSLRSIVKGRMASLRKLTSKPVIVAEVATSPDGGNKAAWLWKGYPDVYSHFPEIKGLIYFNVDMTRDAQPNWMLDVPADALAAYRDLVSQKRFRGHL